MNNMIERYIEPNTDIVAASISDPTENDVFGPTGENAFMQVMAAGHMSRIMFDGNLEQVVLNLDAGDLANLISINFRVWRYNGATFDEVGSSGKIFNAALTAGEQTYGLSSLANIISNVQRGDFLAIVLETPGISSQLPLVVSSGLDSEDRQMMWTQGATDSVKGNGQSFDTTSNGFNPAMSAKMRAPMWCQIGDSLAGGAVTDSSGSVGFFDDLPGGLQWEDVDIDGNMLGQMAVKTDYTGPSGPRVENIDDTFLNYMSAAQGSSRVIDEWSTGGSDFVTDRCIDFKPRFALCEMGINDIAAASSDADIITAYTGILQNLLVNQIIPVVVTVFPYHGGTQEQKDQVVSLNILIKSMCDSLNVLCIDGYGILADGAGTEEYPTLFDNSNIHPKKIAYTAVGFSVANAAMSGSATSRLIRGFADGYRGRYI